jgi:hypothetical protein
LIKLIESPAKKRNLFDRLRLIFLRYLAIGYRQLNPRKIQVTISKEEPLFSEEVSAENLRNFIKSERRFEQLISGASAKYQAARKAIAKTYYN